MSSATSPADYQPAGIHKFYNDHPRLVQGVCAVVLLAGLAVFGYSMYDFSVHGTTSDAIGWIVGGSVTTFVGAVMIGVAIYKVRQGNQASKAWKKHGRFRYIEATKTGLPPHHNINQDRTLIKELKSGILFGVFDGHHHDGHVVAQMAKENFGTHFEKVFEAEVGGGDAAEAMKFATGQIHAQTKGIKGGAVMAVTFIHKDTLERTTAYLGDAEVRSYTMSDKINQTKLTPESSWTEAAAITRIESANAGNEKWAIVTHYHNEKGEFLFPKPYLGKKIGEEWIKVANFTGSIGDQTIIPDELGLLERVPRIVTGQAQAGELYIGMSDGIGDFSRKLPGAIERNWGKGKNLAQVAINSATAYANVDDRTAVTLFID